MLVKSWLHPLVNFVKILDPPNPPYFEKNSQVKHGNFVNFSWPIPPVRNFPQVLPCSSFESFPKNHHKKMAAIRLKISIFASHHGVADRVNVVQVMHLKYRLQNNCYCQNHNTTRKQSNTSQPNLCLIWLLFSTTQHPATLLSVFYSNTGQLRESFKIRTW